VHTPGTGVGQALRPNVALVAFNAPKAAFGALNAPKATLGRFGQAVSFGMICEP
jgi:hypothetical protein